MSVDSMLFENGSSSSARLSLDISELVARALSGAAIDMRTEGERLAERYRELGMSGEMIGTAIARALGMVGGMRSSADSGAITDTDAAEHTPDPQLVAAPAMEAGSDSPPEAHAAPATAEVDLSECFALIDSAIVWKPDAEPEEAYPPENGAELSPGPQPRPVLSGLSKVPGAV